jgi:uncharacterized protein with HEPN domain
MRREEARLRDMLEHITSALDAIEGKDRSEFDANPILQKAVLHDILNIGEASSYVSPELQAKYPRVPWTDVRGFRNVVVHEYFSVDLDIVWQTALNDLVPLRAQIEEVLKVEFPSGTTSE